jgi:haloacetate dehalogenase
VLDILPTIDAWERADARFATAFWPWSLLAQPEPLPERLVSAAPDAVVDNVLGGWGSPPAAFGPEIRAAYIEALQDREHVHAICEEYRAAATRDREDDEADCRAGRRVDCPVLVLWSGRGPLNSWYTSAGGPLAIWRGWANDVQGAALDAGHFFPEEAPQETADALARFFGGALSPASVLEAESSLHLGHTPCSPSVIAVTRLCSSALSFALSPSSRFYGFILRMRRSATRQ